MTMWTSADLLVVVILAALLLVILYGPRHVARLLRRDREERESAARLRREIRRQP